MSPIKLPDKPPRMLTPAQYGSRVNVSTRTVQNLCKTKKIQCTRVGGQWRIPEPREEE